MGEAYFDLGGVLLMSGDAAGAIRNLEQALSLAPHWAEAHYQLGRALLAENRPGQARVQFEATLKDDPQHFSAQQALQEIP